MRCDDADGEKFRPIQCNPFRIHKAQKLSENVRVENRHRNFPQKVIVTPYIPSSEMKGKKDAVAKIWQ